MWASTKNDNKSGTMKFNDRISLNFMELVRRMK
jgi:hypothetical protein